MIFIPEIRVHKVVSMIVEMVRQDYKDKNDKKESFLYRVFEDQEIEDYNLYDQAVTLFNKNASDPRELKVRLFFDAQRAELPTIHINLPSENPGDDGLGTDEGFEEPIFNDLNKSYNRVLNRNFQSTYQVIITSSNSLEVVMLYHVLRAAVIGNIPALGVLGFKNLKISGADLILNPNIVPLTVFVRGFSMHFSYEVSVPVIHSEKFYQAFISLNGIPIIND